MTTTEPSAVIPAEVAHDMRAALWLLEDWLDHTGAAVLDDLAAFAFPHDTHTGRAERVIELITALGGYSAALDRQLQALF